MTNKIISDERLGLIIKHHTHRLVCACCFLYAFGQHLHYELYKLSKWQELFQGALEWIAQSLSEQHKKIKSTSSLQHNQQEKMSPPLSEISSSEKKSLPRCESVKSTTQALSKTKRTTKAKRETQTSRRASSKAKATTTKT